MSYHLIIYIDIKKLPINSRSESIAHFLPSNLTARPLTSCFSTDHVYYYSDTVETRYLASDDDFERFKDKLSHAIRYSIWQPDTYEPGPFRDLLWPGDYLKRSSITGLIVNFDDWDAYFRESNDIHFYKVYCTVRKTLLRFAQVVSATEAEILGKIFHNTEQEIPENSIGRPFHSVELDLVGMKYDQDRYCSRTLFDRCGDSHLI